MRKLLHGFSTHNNIDISPRYHYSDRGWCNHATWVTDGEAIMSRHSHFRCVIFGLVFIILYILNQLPESYRVECDTEKILECFTFENVDGDRETCGPWTSRPEMRSSTTCHTTRESTRDPDDMDIDMQGDPLTQMDKRKAEFALWEASVEKYASTVPIIQVRREIQKQKGVVFDPTKKGGRPPENSASVKGKCTFQVLGTLNLMGRKHYGRKNLQERKKLSRKTWLVVGVYEKI
jgi:hypothetical protein